MADTALERIKLEQEEEKVGKDIQESRKEKQSLPEFQQAFLNEAALQCGICTPGFLVAAKALLDTNPEPTEEEIRFWLAGNLCRCTGYDKIITAVQEASKSMQKK